MLTLEFLPYFGDVYPTDCCSRNTTVLAKLVSFFTNQIAEVIFCKDGLYCTWDTGMGLWYVVVMFLPIGLLGPCCLF